MEVLPGIYMFRSSGNQFLIGGDRPVMVDVGGRRNLGLLRRRLGKAGCSPGEIKEIVITHYHCDHAGCLSALKGITGAEVSVSEGDAPFVSWEREPELAKGASLLGRLQAKHPDLLARYQRYPGVEPDRILKAGDVIDCLGGLEVIDTSGHTPGHISLFSPERSLMLVGDALFHFLGRLTMPFKDWTSDYEKAQESVRKLGEYDFEIACFGHGPPMFDGASRRIREFARTL